MSGRATLITQGAELSLRRVPRKVKMLAEFGGMSVFDSEEFAYLVNVDIGGQEFWFTFDTGSSDLWVVTSNCADPDCQGVPMYTSSTSSSLRISGLFFRLVYLLGSVQGTVATETVTLGTIQIVSQTFALANETNGLYLGATGNSGILGLSFSPAAAIRPTTGMTVLDNIFAHLSDNERFFAFKLGRTNLTDPNMTNSSVTIGKLDPTIVSTPDDAAHIKYFPVFKTHASPYDYWKLPMRNLTIDGHMLPLSTSLIPGAPSPIAILDTGTTLVLGPTLDVNAFWEAIGTGESTRYNAMTNLWEVRCDRAVDVRFAFGEGDASAAEYAVHPEDISWAEGGQGNGWCMGGVQANDAVGDTNETTVVFGKLTRGLVVQVNSGDWLLGDVFLRNVYVVHQGKTSLKPPLVGLLSLTDPQAAQTEFRSARGADPAPPPAVVNRNPTNQWTDDVKIASAVSAAGGFLLGGLLVACFRMRSRRATRTRW